MGVDCRTRKDNMDKNKQALQAIKLITELTDLIVKIESKTIEYNQEKHDDTIRFQKERIVHIVECL